MKQKACKLCNAIYEGEKCPKCNAKESTDSFKGRVIIFDPEKSEIAQKMGVTTPGKYALRLGR